MTYIIYVLIIFNVIAMHFIPQKGKKLLYVLFFVLLLLFMGGSGYKPDYDIYYRMYNGDWPLNKLEFAFNTMINIGHLLYLNYNGFYFLMTFLGLVLLFYSSYKIIGVSPLFCLFYLIWPFFLDIVQIRNLLAMAFLFLAFTRLLTEKKYCKLEYIIFIILGAGFQTIALAYLPFAFIKKLERKKFLSLVLIVTVLLMILVSFNTALIGELIDRFSFLINYDNRFGRYTNRMVEIGYIFNWCLQVSNVMFTLWSKKIINKNAVSTNEKNKNIVNFVLYANVFMFIYCPVYRLDSNFTRLMRNLMPINYISFIISYLSFPKINKYHIQTEKFLYIMFYFIYIFIIVVVQLIIPHKVTIIEAVFNNRWLF